ncbi:hypothetical protein [Luteimonas huabeiensis]|uniref:hypothetical protein n=1 Tax=Luteimonas huabeiensis TaxID=1244513 RepID=UPI0004657C97|nr:hypothetical protein [Luteimonas huabeiensis]
MEPSEQPRPAAQQWTLADFLSTRRYWSFFFATLFAVSAVQGWNALMPHLLIAADAERRSIYGYLSMFSSGGLLGLALAFLVVARGGKASLAAVLAAGALVAAPAALNPQSLLAPWYPSLLGATLGAVNVVFPIAGAFFLSTGRANRVDFAGALILLIAAAMVASIVPVAVATELARASAASLAAGGSVAALIAAAVVLLACQRLTFDDAPPPHHRPLPPRRRSPWLVLMTTGAPLIVAAGLLTYALARTLSFFGPSRISDTLAHPMALLALVLLIAWAAGIAYWLYRIHGEVAAANASPRLLTPSAALWIGMFVPLGLVVVLMTLGDFLNERTASPGRRRAIPTPVLALCVILVPPVAMALIQHAANKTYPHAK